MARVDGEIAVRRCLRTTLGLVRSSPETQSTTTRAPSVTRRAAVTSKGGREDVGGKDRGKGGGSGRRGIRVGSGGRPGYLVAHLRRSQPPQELHQ